MDKLPGDQRVADFAGDLQPEERRVLALAAQARPLDLPPRLRVEHADVRCAACGEFPGGSRCGYYDFLKFERLHQDDPEFIALT